MDVSIILCTWNNSRRLSVTLNSLVKLEIPLSLAWELIVVNNNSTDNTADVVSSFIDMLPINYILEPVQGLSHARNAGLLIASGKLIIFTDDDVKPCKHWLLTYWEAYKLNLSDTFWGGPIESEFESGYVNQTLLQYAPASVKGLDLGNEMRALEDKEYLLSANWACPASAFKKVGGFDNAKGLNPSLNRISIGEETDLMDRLRNNGFHAIYLPEAKISHFVPKDKTSLRHIASRARAWGFYCGEKQHLMLKTGRRAFGVPFWLYKEFLRRVYRFSCGLLKFRVDYKTYLECCQLIGRIEAVRKFSISRKSEPEKFKNSSSDVS